MASQRAARVWAFLSIVALLCGMASAQNGPSIPIKYCATANTADMTPIQSDYQSQGRCFGNCTDANFALAIVQAKNCWCSNIVPNRDTQKSLSNCENPCPGYPTDYCGGSGSFGYMELANDPSGTAPGIPNTKPPTTTSSGQIARETETETMQNTVEITVTLAPSVTPSSELEPSTTAPPNDDGSAPTSTHTPEPTVQTVTVGGVVKTVTATPLPTGSGTPELATTPGPTGLSTGATVGIAIGIVGIFAVCAIFLFLWYLKRKRRDRQEGLFSTSSRRDSSPGALGTPKMGEVSSDARVVTGPNGQPVGGVWDSNAQNSKRRSHLMPIDPRLDPFSTKNIYVRDQNKSQHSISSLQDNHDYSRRIQDPPRVLRATNPDPDD
ncbi:hypothetical protein B0T25DRAFT_568771 [Lasiosphaeria hispida]|uniref:WSC domain-containing protein n=1 Tax=Lasiosphaeria hispida TaxID=260671 RepID=A0AAJ0MEL4_9PEZI|nr:hypothetical protein B0T25DRAFT_568771 [Lasiosphaeria hispida]